MINSVISIALMFLEILAAEIVLAKYLHRRRHYAARLAASICVCLETIVLVSLLYGWATGGIFVYGAGAESVGDSVFKFAYYLLVFALTFGCMTLCYGDKPWSVLFYCSGGYAMQHLGFNVASMICRAAGVNIVAVSWTIELISCAAVFAVGRLLLSVLGADAAGARGVRGKTLVCLAVLFVCIGLSRITIDDSTRSSLAFWAESLYAVISCALILGILFSISQRDKAQSDAAIMEELMRRAKEQFELSKETIDIINIKCHDLKHQISALRTVADADYVKEIENAVMIYDAAARTGNDILDVVLTEKSLLCEKNGITLTCVMDGGALSFMSKTDIYSLFGNALSNAIESVRGIRDKDRRCISITSRPAGGFLSVHMENCYDGEITLEDGLPVTKGDRSRHGFGMRSIKHIAEKYGGSMGVTAENGVFSLDLLFPLSGS